MRITCKKFPINFFLEITKECNLKCQLCKLWQQKDPKLYLKLSQKLDFLEELLNWLKDSNQSSTNPLNVILTGGEPFLKSKQILKIAKFCKENNLRSYVNTNGTLIEPLIDRILKSGLTAITFSLDSYRAAIHDKLRGLEGLFDSVIRTIKVMIINKKKFDYDINICVQSILGNWNVNTLRTHIEFYEELGIDGIMFQPIQYPFGLTKPSKWFKKPEIFPQSKEIVQEAIKLLLDYKSKNNSLMNSRNEIEFWEDYFDNPEIMNSSINPCKAYEQNLILDVNGNIKFCFGRDFSPSHNIGNILTNSIDEIWNGRLAYEVKREMEECNLMCGIMACHIDNDLRN